MDLREAFWSKVDRSGECWTWLGRTNPKGYGVLKFCGVQLSTHRVAWELTHGPIQDDLFVCHDCDNPVCANPAHLFLGTNADNMADMVHKDRAFDWTGRLHPRARLTFAQVAEIRSRASGRAGERDDMAAEFGVTRGQIGRILRRERWQDPSLHLGTRHTRGTRHGQRHSR